MKVITWAGVALVGMALMVFSCFGYRRVAPTPWRDAVMFVGRAEPARQVEGLDCVEARLRLLPFPARPHRSIKTPQGLAPAATELYRLSVQEKLILHPRLAADFAGDMLASGRLPQPGTDEAVAGFNATKKDSITVADRTFKVVGVFQEGVAVFLDSYVVPSDSVHGDLFDPQDKQVRNAYVVQLPSKEKLGPGTREQLAEAFPWGRFVPWRASIRTGAGPFHLYVVGLAILCLGGSALFISLYGYLRSRIRYDVFRSPLAEIGKRKRLFVILHLVYFGTFVLFTVFAYWRPEVRTYLHSVIVDAARARSGPLAFAAEAYLKKNIPLAAFRTLAVNFPLGSFAFITVPSAVLPGSGSVLLAGRFVAWGLMLGPATVSLSRAMLPHSITLLLEGEGYVLASFFALLVPIYLFSKSEGSSIAGRYGRALLMNLKGNLLVVAVLAVAAVYEAVEVILMM